MGYDAALNKSWEGLRAAGLKDAATVRFFTDEFRVDPGSRTVAQTSGQPAKDFVSILLLHYLEKRLLGLPPLTGRWISFKEMESGEQYYPAFRKRSIDLLVKKYARDVEAVFQALDRNAAVGKAGQGDAGVIVEAFPGVPLQVILWKGDDEFPAEATILFDESIRGIFCTEDVAVLAGFTAKYV